MQRAEVTDVPVATAQLGALARVQPRQRSRRAAKIVRYVGQRQQGFNIAFHVEEIDRTARFAPLLGEGSTAGNPGDTQGLDRSVEYIADLEKAYALLLAAAVRRQRRDQARQQRGAHHAEIG